MPEAGEHPDYREIVIPRCDLAIDFANTLAWRGGKREESLHDYTDLLAWLVNAKAFSSSVSAGFSKALASVLASEIRAEALALREVIYRLLHAVAGGPPALPDDLTRLNEALAEAPQRIHLAPSGDGLGWMIGLKPAAAGILAPVLWSAADLLADKDSVRIRACANDQCLWLFLDDSKNGTRRWCSMQACGNRAKAHRHYLRRKENAE
jgi:predicted RNA-binding Zn ribbon-like protein